MSFSESTYAFFDGSQWRMVHFVSDVKDSASFARVNLVCKHNLNSQFGCMYILLSQRCESFSFVSSVIVPILSSAFFNFWGKIIYFCDESMMILAGSFVLKLVSSAAAWHQLAGRGNVTPSKSHFNYSYTTHQPVFRSMPISVETHHR